MNQQIEVKPLSFVPRFMSGLGQTRKSADAITTSALPPTADIPESGCDVRKVPRTDSCTAANQQTNSKRLVGAGSRMPR